MKREYETVCVLKPDLPAARLVRVKEKVGKIITDQGGELLVDKDWGKRKLAYKIEKNQFGHYLYFNYNGSGVFISDLERTLKYEEDVIRYLTVKLDTRKTSVGKGKVSMLEEGKLKNEDLRTRDFEDRGPPREYSRDVRKEEVKKDEVINEGAKDA